MARIAVITDSDMIGSGYLYVMMPLLTELAKLGHDIKVAGLNYMGTEHHYPFSIIPAKDLQDCVAVLNNLHYLWQPDVFLVGMDVPLQLKIFEAIAPFKRPYIAITPLENGPLTMSWAAGLFNMSYVFFISELGKQEAMKAGLSNVGHLLVGVDTESWKVPTPEDKQKIRVTLGIAPDEYVILSVADNQERKNLWAACEIVARLKKEVSEKKFRFILVTREHNPYGWKLRDLAVRLDINMELNLFERGMPRQNLWGLYAASDLYLNTSKGEGLGMPVLDAMAMKLPVVATDTGALHELLDNSRGFLIPAIYTFTDVWGNSRRDMIDVELAKNIISELVEHGASVQDDAYEYIKTRTWDVPAKQVHEVVERLSNEQR